MHLRWQHAPAHFMWSRPIPPGRHVRRLAVVWVLHFAIQLVDAWGTVRRATQPLPPRAHALSLRRPVGGGAASCSFEAQRFGNEASAGVTSLKEALEAGLARELVARHSANALASVRICDEAEAACEAMLEREQRAVLPSTTRFTSQFQACLRTFTQRCIGPGVTSQVGPPNNYL